MEKTFITFGDTEIEKHKFYQYKSPISINNTDINKIEVSNKSLLVEKVLNILLATKFLKEIDLDEYFFQKLVHIEETLMKLNLCRF